MYLVFLRFSMICGVMVILLTAACAPPPEPTTQITAEVNIQGDVSGVEEIQTIELDNCGGKANATRIEERTRSIDVTISSEVAAKVGASAAVLTAEVQTAVGVAIIPGSERSTHIELVAPPDTRMIFELVWVGNEQIGIVQNIRNSDVPVAFRSFLPTDVRIRGQYDMGCSGSSSPQPVFEPTTPPTPPLTEPGPGATMPGPTTTTTTSGINDCGGNSVRTTWAGTDSAISHHYGFPMSETAWGATADPTQPSMDVALIFGPYIDLGPGEYKVVYRMRISGNLSPNTPVIRLNVGANVDGVHRPDLTNRMVSFGEVTNPNEFQEFEVSFVLSDCSTAVEFRAFYQNSGDVEIDQITLTKER